MVKLNIGPQNINTTSALLEEAVSHIGYAAISTQEQTTQYLLGFLAIEMDAVYKITCNTGEGKQIVQRIRMRLSRLREKAKKQDLTLKYFKMLVEFIGPHDKIEEKELVILKKASTLATKLSNDMAEALHHIARVK